MIGVGCSLRITFVKMPIEHAAGLERKIYLFIYLKFQFKDENLMRRLKKVFMISIKKIFVEISLSRGFVCKNFKAAPAKK